MTFPSLRLLRICLNEGLFLGETALLQSLVELGEFESFTVIICTSCWSTNQIVNFDNHTAFRSIQVIGRGLFVLHWRL